MAHNNNHNHRANGGGYHEGWKRYREDHRRGYAANGHSANTSNGFGDGASSSTLEGRFLGEGSAYGGQQEHRYGRPASSSGNNTPSHASSSSRLPRGLKKPSSIGGQDPFAKQAGVNASGSSSKSLGTSPVSGENPADSGFTKLLHHVDFRSNVARSEPGSKRKNYRVIYDPELDLTLSKGERKSKPKKLRFNGEGLDTALVKDPRKASIAQYFQKPNKASKKFPFKQLPQAKWAFDKDSLGPPPQTELVVWDLPSTVSEVYLANYFRSYGDPIKEMKFINDPINAVPLGVATFKFQGSLDKAMGLAKKLIHTINTDHAKIDGADLRIGLNDHKNELLKRKVDASIGKLKAFKHKLEEEEEKKKRMRRQLLDLEEKKKKEEQQQREKQEKERLEKQPKIPDLFAKYRPNTTTSSIRHNHKIISGTFLPTDLIRYIKDRPYLIIRDKYVSTKRIPSEDIKRVLNKYNWTRVLTDKSGFYVVFNSLKECEKCFLKEDGRKFYEFSMFMELNVPAGYDSKKELNGSGQSTKNSDMDMVNEAANILLKDFQSFLVKDIQERVIAPALLGLLGHEKYPELVEELKRKDAASKAAALPLVNSTDRLKQDALSLLAKQRLQQHHQIQQQQLLKLPSFKRRDELRQKNSVSIVKKKSLIPMQHALNYTNSDVDSGDSGEDDDDDDEETSRSQTPIKRDRGSAATSATEEDVSEPIKKQRKLNKSLLGDAGDEETPGIIDIKMIDAYKDTAQVPEPASKVDDDDEEFDYSKVEAKYQPTPKRPITVYEETAILPNDVFDLETFQSVVKDEEDLVYARKVLADIEQSSHKNVEYWAWKQKDVRHALEEISEDLELITPLVQRLESKTGAFRSEGYRKIPDADKAEYLPHRRKVHKPIKTIQHEGDDDDDLEEAANINSADQSNNKENGSSNGTGNNSNNNNNNNNNNSMNGNIQSSRVNRANNRRFAADITAQLGAETESLSLNALTKRKKPVTFARSSIHNWGLYALEPIAAKEMIIEYVGESIRQQVSDNRERSYLKTGIGSSYLFRVDENTVIDATKKGGIARFINHCCNPSCTAKIIKVEGKKRIVIYALRDIDTNEELTYDYKFERETNDSERIRCLCGAPGCKGYLN